MCISHAEKRFVGKTATKLLCCNVCHGARRVKLVIVFQCTVYTNTESSNNKLRSLYQFRFPYVVVNQTHELQQQQQQNVKHKKRNTNEKIQRQSRLLQEIFGVDGTTNVDFSLFSAIRSLRPMPRQIF